MADLIRVRLKSGTETNVGSTHVAKFKDEFEVLDEAVEPVHGRPKRATRKGGRPRKPQTTVADQVAGKKAVTSASKKEGSS